MTVVAVCICTYLRPVGLARLLDALTTGQRLGDLTVCGEPVRVRVVVADNEASGPRRGAVEEFAARVPAEVDYVVEPRRGIAQARNAALRVALPEADVVVFVDDDEVPEPGWLDELLAMRERTGADVVTGPVLPVFDGSVPRWVADGGFFQRPRYGDGESLHYSWTSNVLVAREAFEVADPPFDERLGLAGGEDTYFFRQVHLAGRRIVWADKAVVCEHVPPSRCTAGWLLRREYRRGNTLSFCLVSLEGSVPRRAKRAARAALTLAHGVLLLLPAPLAGRAGLVRAGMRMSFAAGLFSGMLGRVYQEYERVHGG